MEIIEKTFLLTHIHPQQAVNCSRNARLVVDKYELKSVANEQKRYSVIIKILP